MKYMKNIC